MLLNIWFLIAFDAQIYPQYKCRGWRHKICPDWIWYPIHINSKSNTNFVSIEFIGKTNWSFKTIPSFEICTTYDSRHCPPTFQAKQEAGCICSDSLFSFFRWKISLKRLTLSSVLLYFENMKQKLHLQYSFLCCLSIFSQFLSYRPLQNIFEMKFYLFMMKYTYELFVDFAWISRQRSRDNPVLSYIYSRILFIFKYQGLFIRNSKS